MTSSKDFPKLSKRRRRCCCAHRIASRPVETHRFSKTRRNRSSYDDASACVIMLRMRVTLRKFSWESRNHIGAGKVRWCKKYSEKQAHTLYSVQGPLYHKLSCFHFFVNSINRINHNKSRKRTSSEHTNYHAHKEKIQNENSGLCIKMVAEILLGVKGLILDVK